MHKKILVPLIILMLLAGCTSARQEVILSDTPAQSVEQTEGSDLDAAKEPEPLEATAGDTVLERRIAVYVCGAVVNQGVYELDEGSRIVDALELAGGFSADADTTYVNLAALLTDGMKLQIPTKEEVASNNTQAVYESYDGSGAAATSTGSSSLININTATKDELTALSGIGDATAEKIIRYREDNGGFSKIEDIMKISGIKEKLFSKIRDQITV